VASNHLSFADPTTLTAFCLAAGRVPRYLAKASLWNLPVVRSVMRSGRHIPVYRGAATASEAFRDAVTSVKAGECVAIFPEATFSKDPAGWPMRGKTGVARIALETGAPVIPVANWGTHHLLPATAWFPRGVPRKTVDLVAGPPVDLSDLAGRELTRAVLEEATARIMAAVTDLLVTLRGERPPVAA
jgi:1-acyl-sn-glycerol-3-phosphate acyltransferase